jgi:hypothetical protein
MQRIEVLSFSSIRPSQRRYHSRMLCAQAPSRPGSSPARKGIALITLEEASQ